MFFLIHLVFIAAVFLLFMLKNILSEFRGDTDGLHELQDVAVVFHCVKELNTLSLIHI